MSDTKLPEWPDRSLFVLDCTACHINAFYERARADAAMARLRVAVAELQYIATEDISTPYPDEYGGIYGPRCAKTLAAIGPLPQSEASEAERE